MDSPFASVPTAQHTLPVAGYHPFVRSYYPAPHCLLKINLISKNPFFKLLKAAGFAS